MPFNLSVDRELKRQMTIYAAETGDEVSNITEQLYFDFLKKKGKAPVSYRPLRERKRKS